MLRVAPWLGLSLLIATRAWAQPSTADVDPLALQVHGFVSQGFLVSSYNNYLAKSTQGSFEFSEVGINFTKPLTENIRLGVQFFTHDLGPIGNYSAKADWFYLDYHYRDWLGFRAGRVKLPFGLYNEINDIDSARVPILLPQSAYPIQNRDYLLAQTGVEVYGRLDMTAAGALDYRIYGGTIFLEPEVQAGSPYSLLDFNIPYVVGGRLLYETPIDGLRVAGSVQDLRLDANLQFDTAAYMPLITAGALPADFKGRVTATVPVLLWMASIEYAGEEWVATAEYGRWEAEVDSSTPALFPESKSISERMYVLLSRRLTKWLQPAAYYSLLFPNVHDHTGRDAKQHDVAGTLRFDINEHWLLKLEGHYLNGTAALAPALNDGKRRSALTSNWVLFLAKTTAYF